ncbi:MAG: hypothetical protein HY904_25725, partial [Deltaproteobacteria bacterium]|nr:hypothetical protein [Deltaproteobacteria bacterium]
MNGLGLCTRHASAMALLVWAAGCRWGAPDRPAGPVGDDAPGCAENSVAVVTSAGVLPCQARCLPGESSPCRRGEGCVARDDGAMSYCMPIYPTDPAAGAALRCPERGVAAVSSAGTFPCQARCQPGDHSPCRTGEGCVWRDDGAESWCMPIYPAHPHASTRLTCPERGVAAVSSAGIFPCQARCQSGDSSPCRAGEGCVARDDGAESYCMPIYPVDPDASAALACSHHSVPAVSAAGVLPCQARCVPGDSSPCRRGEGCVSRDDGAQSYCMPIYPTDPAAGAGLSCPQRSVAAVSAAGMFPCQARCTPGDSSPCRTGEGCVSR